MRIVSVEQMRTIEAQADASGLHYAELMERAGQATAYRALQMLQGIETPRITILVGKGNNGGDGLVAARYLAEQNADVRCYLLERLPEDNAPFQAAQTAGLFLAYAEDDDGRVLRHMVASADLVIDALFGIGIRLPLRDNAVKILRGVSQSMNERRRAVPDNMIYYPSHPHHGAQIAFPRVLAVDCPSGLDCDTGELDTNALHADETITFIAIKQGQVKFPGAAAVGKLTIAPLGVDDDRSELILAEKRFIDSKLPPRTADSNKGTYGKVMVIGGSGNFSGAPSLCATAAYRSGAGLVTVGSTRAVNAVAGTHLKEATFIHLQDKNGVICGDAASTALDASTGYSTLLIGPGLGQAEATNAFLTTILTTEELPSLVLDADALNILSKQENWWEHLPDNTIITPHPGEMARLTGLSTTDVQAQRVKIAQEKSNTWGLTVVLKGAHTVIASPGQPTVIMPFKSDALATAGTGDVLAGLIAGFVAQGITSHDAACVGAYIHGLAGELAAETKGSARGVIADDVIQHIPQALAVIEK